MKHAARLLKQTDTACLFVITDLEQQRTFNIAVCRRTGQMQQKVDQQWTAYTHDAVQNLIQLLLGHTPVTSSMIINMLALAPNTAAVETVTALIEHLPIGQRPTIRMIANQRLLESQGCTPDELSA